MKIESLESHGGPFLLLAQSRLTEWGGSIAHTFSEDADENDYDLLCDRLHEQDYEESSTIARDHFAIFSDTLALDVTNWEDSIYIAPRIERATGNLLIAEFLSKEIDEDTTRPTRTFAIEAGSYILFEAAWSGDEIADQGARIDIDVEARPSLIEIPVLDGDMRFFVYRLKSQRN